MTEPLNETAIRRSLNGDESVLLLEAPVSLLGVYELLTAEAVGTIVEDCGYWVQAVEHTDDGSQYICARC